MLTSINAQQVYRRAKQIDHRSKVAVTRALISLQQVPLELTKDERLLALLPINDQWSQEIASRLDWVRNAWPIATGLSIAWVLVSFLFALVDSFGSFDSTADGHAICTLWSWLLCLVIGWSWVPAFTSDELRPAIIHTNHRVARKAAKRIGQADPAHHQSTASLQIPPENEQPHGNPIIGANPTANQSDASVARSAASPIDPGTDGLLVSKMLTPLNRDEFRLAATFNYSRVMRYLLLVDDVFRTLDRITRKKDEVCPLREGPMFECSSLIPNRKGGLSARLPPSPRGTLYFPRERSRRCSSRWSSPLFSSAEQPLRPP